MNFRGKALYFISIAISLTIISALHLWQKGNEGDFVYAKNIADKAIGYYTKGEFEKVYTLLYPPSAKNKMNSQFTNPSVDEFLEDSKIEDVVEWDFEGYKYNDTEESYQFNYSVVFKDHHEANYTLKVQQIGSHWYLTDADTSLN